MTIQTFSPTKASPSILTMGHPSRNRSANQPEWSEHYDEVHFSGKVRPKTAAESRDFLKVPAYPEMINELGHVKAGHVLKLIDIGGSLPAKRHLGANNVVVTASVDRTNFINPIRRWELITLDSRLTRTWKSSMETQVKVSAWNFRTGETRPIATAHLVFVALDANRKKIQVPPLVPTSLQDVRLAKAADLRKENRMKEVRENPDPAIDLQTDNPIVLERSMSPNESNALNNVFGGVILDIMDEVGGQAARRQSLGSAVIGVRLDRMSFLEPSFIGETLRAKAVVTKTWNTSMEVKVEVESLNPATGQVRQVASSYLVYVALDPDGKPVPVPPWVPETETQKKRADAADLRRKIRSEEEKETEFPKLTKLSTLERLKWGVLTQYYRIKEFLTEGRHSH